MLISNDTIIRFTDTLGQTAQSRGEDTTLNVTRPGYSSSSATAFQTSCFTHPHHSAISDTHWPLSTLLQRVQHRPTWPRSFGSL